MHIYIFYSILIVMFTTFKILKRKKVFSIAVLLVHFYLEVVIEGNFIHNFKVKPGGVAKIQL